MEVRIMPEKQMKDRIAEELKKAKDAGQITKEKVADILKTAVSDAAAGTRGRLESVRTVVKNAVVTGVEAAEEAGKEVRNVAHNAFEGVQKGIASVVEATGQRLKEAGKATTETAGKAAHAIAEDAGKFGKRPVDFARGAISGMWEGAKEVIGKTKIYKEKDHA
jgi:ElaB/YqjD/DUF883 family membrane-anchored ribosome-binding protein